MYTFTREKRLSTSGVTLLIAFLAMTMAFSLATGIFTLLFSEFQIASQESDSVKAFYAANTGLECARYWDAQRDNPNAPGVQTNYLAFSGGSGVNNRHVLCNGATYSLEHRGGSSDRRFHFELLMSDRCADISIRKQTDNSTNRRITTITSRGRVRANADCSLTSRTVERALEFTYTERLPANNP